MIEAAFNPDAPQKLAEFIKQFGPNFPVGTVDQGFVGPYSQITPEMRPTVPIMFFIDRTFTIRSQSFGGDPLFNNGDMGTNIRAEITKLVNEKPAGPAGAAGKKAAVKKK